MAPFHPAVTRVMDHAARRAAVAPVVVAVMMAAPIVSTMVYAHDPGAVVVAVVVLGAGR